MSRAIIFGLDGATFDILRPLASKNVMPNLAAFLKRGARGILGSTVPPLTPTAWSSLVTGRSPGNHGVTGFFQYESAESSSLRIVSSRELRSETIWAMANRHGLRAASLNFPIHCPPPRIDGCVIPGWVPWKWIKRFSHPRGFVDDLIAQIPGLDIQQLAMDFEEERKSIAGEPIDDYEGWIALHLRRDRQWFSILRHLVAEKNCELLGIVFDGVDKLQHLLWPYLDPGATPSSPSAQYLARRELCWQYFRQIDAFLGELIELAGPDCYTYIVSDHGFTGTDEILFINSWLEREGYLTWKSQAQTVADDCHDLEPDFYRLSAFDMNKTTAFALTASSNGIHIVVRGRRNAAGIPPEDYFAFRDRLAKSLLTRCVDAKSGEPLISRIWTREEAFSGPAMDIAPDLTLELRDHGFFSVRRSNQLVARRQQVMGTHHPDGVFIAAGPGIRARASIAPLRLIDVAPTVLYSLGIPIPRGLDGRVAEEIFTVARLRNQPPRYDGAAMAAAVSGESPPVEDTDLIQRLKALGYIE